MGSLFLVFFNTGSYAITVESDHGMLNEIQVL